MFSSWQVMLTAVADYHSEGHDAFHPVNRNGSYESQKKETLPHIERFTKERIPKWVFIFFIPLYQVHWLQCVLF